MTRSLCWLLALVLLGVFGAAVVITLRARLAAGTGMPAYSVYSEDADEGLAEAGRQLRLWGWEPVAVTRPVQNTHDQGLLVLVEPEGTARLPGEDADLTDAEVKGLLHWVEQGNTLLFCCGRITNLHHALGIDLSADNRSEHFQPTTADLGEAGPYTARIDRLVVDGRKTLGDGTGLPLWWVGQNPGAVVVGRGRGRVLVIADPSLVTLPGLEREDNVLFLYNVARLHARGGRVYFDEYHHGLRSAGGFWGYLRYHNLQWTLLPILLVVGMAVWRAAVRLGPAVPTPKAVRADAVDYASAVARIYQRAGARRLLARTLARAFPAALTRHLRLRRAALPAEILAAWRQRYPRESTQRLQGLLRGLAELRRGDVSDRQLLTWARAFDQFEKEATARKT
jgi:hypothetical protein